MKSYSTFSICIIYLIFVPLNPPLKIRAKDIVLKVLENFQTSTYPVKKHLRQSNYPDKNSLKRCFSSFTIQFSSKSFKYFMNPVKIPWKYTSEASVKWKRKLAKIVIGFDPTDCTKILKKKSKTHVEGEYYQLIWLVTL